MSKPDKEAVLKQFTTMYKRANGKTPKIEASNGWYSVDGGKNMRLTELETWAEELNAHPTSTSPKSKPKAPASKTKVSSQSKSSVKKKNDKKGSKQKKQAGSGGSSATEVWRDYLQQQAGESKLPRGLK